MLATIEDTLQRAGAAAVAVFLVSAFWGAGRAARQPDGRIVGWRDRSRWWLFIVLAGLAYGAACVLLWQPLPLVRAAPWHTATLLLGAGLFFGGLALWFWARRALGPLFDFSSGFSVRLQAGHRLVASGPFALVRHPMYLGVLAAAVGAIGLYWTWTAIFAAAGFLGLFRRARREEEALALEFGAEWTAYCERVPAWFPRFWPPAGAHGRPPRGASA